jgi:hypothetical protein
MLSGFLHMGMPFPLREVPPMSQRAMLAQEYKTVGYSFYLDARI